MFATPPDYEGLALYLEQFDIDPSRIPEDSVDETGYDYWPPFNSGIGLKLGNQSERRAWPSKAVYRNVVRLMQGEAAQ